MILSRGSFAGVEASAMIKYEKLKRFNIEHIMPKHKVLTLEIPAQNEPRKQGLEPWIRGSLWAF